MDKQKSSEITVEKLAELEECVFGMYEYGCSGHVLASTQRLIKELVACVESSVLQTALKQVVEKCGATYGVGTCIHAQHSLRMGDVEQTLREIMP
jgi:hypothetical protein